MPSKCRFDLTAALLLGAVLVAAPAYAQDRPAQPAASSVPVPATGAPGVITQGSSGVSVGGMPAARVGDATDQGSALIEGSPNVFINGRPAATLGGRTGCGGITIGGSSNVFVNGKPLARAGDLTSGCDKK